jgi:hypothetical protein
LTALAGGTVGVVEFPSGSAEQDFEAIKEACKDPMTEVRCCFADGEWETLKGPAFLERFAANRSGGVRIDWVRAVER